MTTKPLIYLCGPIHGLPFSELVSWRDIATRLLAPEFDVLTPLHGREWDGRDYSRYSDAEIVVRDLAYIRRARAVLRFYEGQSSEGSAMETFFASREGIPVVTWGDVTHRPFLSLWLRVHTVQNFFKLEEAVAFLKTQWLMPGEDVEPAYNVADYLTVP